VSSIGQTEERLIESAQDEVPRWSSEKGGVQEQLVRMNRWTGEGWINAESPFQEVNRWLSEAYNSSPEKFKEVGYGRFVHTCCANVLAQLDVAGHLGGNRSKVVLNIYIPDQSDDESLWWAKQLNPYQVVEAYQADLQLARAAYEELHYIGPV
jgi:hypothetical protein